MTILWPFNSGRCGLICSGGRGALCFLMAFLELYVNQADLQLVAIPLSL